MKLKWPISAAALITLTGSPLARIDARGTSATPLVISLPRLSPALAAFEDLGRTWNREAAQQAQPKIQVRLTSGVSAIGLVSLTRIAQPQEVPLLSAWLAKVPLGGRLKIAVPEIARGATKSEVVRLAGMTIRQQKATSPSEDIAKVQLEKSEVRAVAKNYEARSEVSLAERNRVVRELAAQDWRQPTFAEAAQKLIKSEASPSPGNEKVKQLGGILVAAPVESTTAPPPLGSGSGSIHIASGQRSGSTPRAAISWASPETGSSAPATLSGSIEFAGGLALTGPQQQVVVFRQIEGLSVERGTVWMEDGRFEVRVRSLRGRLVGQLQDHRGRVIGQGEVRLGQISRSDATDRIENLKLKLSPVVTGARVEVLSAHSYDNFAQTVDRAKVWLMGAETPLRGEPGGRYFSEEGLGTGSTYVAQTIADNHWGTIVVGMAGEETHTRLFPNKMMDALLNLTLGANRSMADQSGVIWGRVTQNGLPVSGATVEMAGDQRNQPHYFNSLLLPDRFAESTGENGTFAFVWVTPGIQSVRVVYKGQSYPAQVIPVEKGNVSYLEFELGHLDRVPFQINDPMDPAKEISAMVRWAGDETSEVDVQGHGSLNIPSGPGLMTLEVDAGNPYEMTRYTVPRSTRRIDLPAVRRDWIMNLVARRRVNISSGVGMVVGYAIDDNFTVRLDARQGEVDQPEVIYFDSRGQALFSDEGVAGGGFVIFNVPTGLQTVAVMTQSSSKVYTEVVVASPEAVNVISSIGRN